MCSTRCGSAFQFGNLKASKALVVAFAASVVDSLLLTPHLHDPGRHAPALSLLEARGNASAPELPERKRIAILVRGETFRHIYRDDKGAHRKSCAKEAMPMQMNCTNSLVSQIIEPLEQRGNTIEVLFATTAAQAARYHQALGRFNGTPSAPGCHLDKLIHHAFWDKNRVVKWKRLVTSGQANAMILLLDVFNQEYGGSAEAVRKHFDYVMIVRHDMLWFQSIVWIQDHFRPDFRNLNVLRRCQVDAGESNGGKHCVLDTFWMMPTTLYPAFASAIGHDNCFDPASDPIGNGHACQVPIREAIAKAGYPNAFGWLEPSRIWARGRGQIGVLVKS